MSALKLDIELDPSRAVNASSRIREGLNDVADAAGKAEKALDSAGKATSSIENGHRVVRRSADGVKSAFAGIGNAADHMGRTANDNLRQVQRDMVAAAGATTLFGRAVGVARVAVVSFATATAAAMRVFLPLMAVMGGAAAVAGVVRTSTEFESLNASLKTMTGSAANAGRAMAYIQQFASETPYSLQEVTEAFIKLQGLGLDPSRKALEAYGNTASAMSKPIMQFVEAVADAVTGENERLKEFGITASVNGEKVSYTFQGVTKTIGNNAAEIEGYLRSIGQVQFAGAMADQMSTLNGVFSGMQDEIAKFQNAIGEGGLSAAVKRVASDTTEFFKANEELGRSIGALAGGTVTMLADHFGFMSGVLSEVWGWLKATVEVAAALTPTFQNAGQQIASASSLMASAAESLMSMWVEVGRVIHSALNSIIGVAVGSYQTIIATWNQMPAAFGALAKGAANALLSGLEAGVNGALAGINSVIGAVNGIAPAFAQIPTVPGLDLSGYKQSLNDAQKASADTAQTIIKAATSTNYLGEGFDAVVTPIIEAKKRIDEAAASTQTVGEQARLTGEGFQIIAPAAGQAGAATGEMSKQMERAKTSFADLGLGAEEAVSALQRQIDAFDASEGASAALPFRAVSFADAVAYASQETAE